jgi:hypothetical protein
MEGGEMITFFYIIAIIFGFATFNPLVFIGLIVLDAVLY